MLRNAHRSLVERTTANHTHLESEVRRTIESSDCDELNLSSDGNPWLHRSFLSNPTGATYGGIVEVWRSLSRLDRLGGGKKETVIPIEAARNGLRADPRHLLKGGVKLPTFPFRYGALRYSRYRRQFGLRDGKYVFANASECAHSPIIRKRIYSSRHFIRERMGFGPKLQTKQGRFYASC